MEVVTTDKPSKHSGKPLDEKGMKEWEKTWKDIDNAIRELEEHGEILYMREK